MTDSYRHVARIIRMVMTALDAPSSSYLEAVLIHMGFETYEWTRCLDDWLVDSLTCSLRLNEEKTFDRLLSKVRKGRERLNKWQAEEGNPILIEHRLVRSPDGLRTYSEYRVLVGELILDILTDCPDPTTGDAFIRKSVNFHLNKYLERFDGTAKKDSPTRTHSTESDYSRAATLSSKAYMRDYAKPDRGESAGLNGIVDAFLDRHGADTCLKIGQLMVQKSLEKIEPTQVSNVTPGAYSTKDLQPQENLTLLNSKDLQENDDFPSVTPYCLKDLASETGLDPENLEKIDPPVTDVTPRRDICHTGKLLGMSRDDFLDQMTIEQAAERNGRKIDLTSPLRRHTKAHPCPICGGPNCTTPDFGQLTICRRQSQGAHHQAKNGAGWVHYHDREIVPYLAPPIKPFKALISPIDLYGSAQPLAATAGAKYLLSRGIRSDIASASGVRNFFHVKIGKSVIFPLRDHNGEIVATQCRALSDGLIIGCNKWNDGPTGQAIFSAPWQALDADRLAICEAPIDALALAAAGLPAIATCGDKNWPAWLPEALTGKSIFLASDADKAGDEAAGRQSHALDGYCILTRLRPQDAKDWAEIAELHGLDALRNLIEIALMPDRQQPPI